MIKIPLLRHLALDRRASIAIAFALLVIPATAAIGSAVDFSRWSAAKAAVQTQVDSAALSAIGKAHDPEALRRIEYGLRERLAKLDPSPAFTTVRVEKISADSDPVAVVRVRAEGELPMLFAHLLGQASVGISADAEAQTSYKSYEVSLVVDVTGSMRGQRINSLRQASRAFVNALLPEPTESERILVNIVPYTASVNIGRERGFWLAPLASSPGAANGTGRLANRYIWTADEVRETQCRGTAVTWDDELQICYIGEMSTWTGAGPCPGVTIGDACLVADGWSGCVEERGRGGDDVTDASPAQNPFQPYFWPSYGGIGNPSASVRFNSYLPGRVNEERATLSSSNDGRGPNLGCPLNPILDWTNDPRPLISQIDSFEAWHRGGTMGHIGLVWAWRTLSPEWADHWGDHSAPRAYDSRAVEKIVVFMTDGENGFYTGHAPDNDSDYTAYGRLSENPGVTRSSQRTYLNEKMLDVCSAMKRAGIEIFSVGYVLGNSGAANGMRNLLRSCATSEEHFFDASTRDLVSRFRDIATTIRARGERISR